MNDLVDEIQTALQQTLGAKTARVVWSIDHDWSLPEFPPRHDRGPVRTAITGVGKAAGKMIGKGLVGLATRRVDPRHMTGEGVIDLAGRRYQVDYGSYATLQIASQQWHGRSGRALDTLPASPADAVSPLWLIDLVAGVHAADELDPEAIDGQSWRHLMASASLLEASRRRPEGLPSPPRARFDELLALPIELWLGDGYVRRLRFAGDNRIDTVTLSEFGVDTDDIDWSRLPVFCTDPGD